MYAPPPRLAGLPFPASAALPAGPPAAHAVRTSAVHQPQRDVTEQQHPAAPRQPHCDDASAAAPSSANKTLPGRSRTATQRGRANSTAALAAAEHVPDIEDLVTRPRNWAAAKRPRGLRVSDILSSASCQVQACLTLALPPLLRRRPTAAMITGTKRHHEAEAEACRFASVALESREDHYALRLMNTALALKSLLLRGLAREVFVYGQLQGVWAVGVIDELRLFKCTCCEVKSVRVVELKTTRQAKGELKQEQLELAKLQAMLYRALLLQLRAVSGPQLRLPFLRALKLQPMGILGRGVQGFARCAGLGSLASLSEVLELLHATACALPDLSTHVSVVVACQRTGEVLQQHLVRHSQSYVRKRVAEQLRFWQGAAPPQPPPVMGAWKCGRCNYNRNCPYGAARTAPQPQAAEAEAKAREAGQAAVQADGA